MRRWIKDSSVKKISGKRGFHVGEHSGRLWLLNRILQARFPLSLFSLCVCASIAVSPAETIAETQVETFYYQESAEKAYLGLRLTPEEGWHTYWRNPGDAGMAPQLTLEDASLEVSLLVLPAPQRFEMSGIVGYGYDTTTVYAFQISGKIPEILHGKAQWLSCDDTQCLSGKVAFSHPSQQGKARPDWVERALRPLKEVKKTDVKWERWNDDTGWKISFSSADALEGWEIFPFTKNFSEIAGSRKLLLQHGKYQFSYDSIGSLPEEVEFLLTQGTAQLVLSLSPGNASPSSRD